MSKKKTYFQVHKNKKPKLRNPNDLHTVYKMISAARELVNSILELRNAMFAFKKTQIPDYSKGLSNDGKMHIVGNGNYKERVINQNGIPNDVNYFIKGKDGLEHKLPPPIDFSKINNETQINRVFIVPRDFREKLSLSIEDFKRAVEINVKELD
jgi:hypothetical protein